MDNKMRSAKLYSRFEKQYAKASLRDIEKEIVRYTDEVERSLSKVYYPAIMMLIAFFGRKSPIGVGWKTIHVIYDLVFVFFGGISVYIMIAPYFKASPHSRVEYLKMKRERMLREENSQQ